MQQHSILGQRLKLSMRRNPLIFTRKETVERLQEVKSFLGNKERLAFRAAKTKFLPEGYDPESDESYYAAPQLEDHYVKFLSERVLTLVSANWFTDLSFRKLSTVDFVCWDLAGHASTGSVIDIAFYPWKRDDNSDTLVATATKFASIWLGTWHHAPVIAWRQAGSAAIKVESPPKYSDLIK